MRWPYDVHNIKNLLLYFEKKISQQYRFSDTEVFTQDFFLFEAFFFKG